MKYRYYVVDMHDGCIEGTNASDAAKILAKCEGFYVLDAEAGEWLCPNNKIADIPDLTRSLDWTPDGLRDK